MSSSVLPPCWRGEVCDRGDSLSMSTPGDICGTPPTLPSICSWFLPFLDPRMWSFAQGISRWLISQGFQSWYCRLRSLLLSLCPGCWVSSSCLGVFPDPRLLCWSWIRKAYHAICLVMLRKAVRRLQISGLSSSLQLRHSAWYLFASLAIGPVHLSVSIAALCWTIKRTADPLVSFLYWLETRHFPCLSRLFLLVGCKAVVAASHMQVWLRSISAISILQSAWCCQMLSWNLLCLCTMVLPTLDIAAPALCTPSGDPHICGWAETLPGQVAALCAARGQVERTIPLQTACTVLVDHISACSFLHPLCLLFCRSDVFWFFASFSGWGFLVVRSRWRSPWFPLSSLRCKVLATPLVFRCCPSPSLFLSDQWHSVSLQSRTLPCIRSGQFHSSSLHPRCRSLLHLRISLRRISRKRWQFLVSF